MGKIAQLFSNLFNKEMNNKDEIKSLLADLNNQKYEALNRYDYDIEMLLVNTSRIYKLHRERTKQKISDELSNISLAGFGAEEKIKDFEKVRTKIFSKEWELFQAELRSLGETIYRSEKSLEKEFENIINELSRNCGRLRAPEPNLECFSLPNGAGNSTFVSPGGLANVSRVGILSVAGALGFFPASAYADGGTHVATHGATHGVAHGATHGATHGTAHVIAHGTAHGVGHGAAHAFGWLVPGLNVALITYSAFCLGKFFFDDSDAKKKYRDHICNDIDSAYRKVVEGDGDVLGLDAQVRHIRAEFKKRKEDLFNKAIEPTLEGVLKALNSAT